MVVFNGERGRFYDCSTLALTKTILAKSQRWQAIAPSSARLPSMRSET